MDLAKGIVARVPLTRSYVTNSRHSRHFVEVINSFSQAGGFDAILKRMRRGLDQPQPPSPVKEKQTSPSPTAPEVAKVAYQGESRLQEVHSHEGTTIRAGRLVEIDEMGSLAASIIGPMTYCDPDWRRMYLEELGRIAYRRVSHLAGTG